MNEPITLDMSRRNLFLSALIVFLGGSIIVSCSENDELPETARKELNFDNENYQYFNTTAEIGKLGRVLFYDNALSINDAVACASCHKQSLAFADVGKFSEGFNQELTTRNTPPIQNLGNAGFFIFDGDGDFELQGEGQALFWDGRTRVLEQMVLEPVSNHIEMGMRSPSDLLARLSQRGYYTKLFEEAYGDDEISLEKISHALASFVRSFQSNGSPFEQEMNSFGGQFLTPQQREGFELFVNKYDCLSCHDINSGHGYSEPIGQEFANIGLDQSYTDKGLGGLSGNSSEDGKFRIPNLRNIALTAPYMHDGRFETLEEVIGHYNNSIQAHPNLDDRLKTVTGEPRIMNISAEEQESIVAFLHALTDHQFISDPRFSDPFK